MKFVIALFFIFTSSILYSQNKIDLSAAFSAGVCAHGSSQIDPYTGIDIEARHNNFSIFISGSGAFSFDSLNSNIYEFIIGPRWYIGNPKKVNVSIETGFGDFIYSKNTGSSHKLGISLGAGLHYLISAKTDLGLKGRYNFHKGGYGTSMGEVYLSLRYYFNK